MGEPGSWKMRLATNGLVKQLKRVRYVYIYIYMHAIICRYSIFCGRCEFDRGQSNLARWERKPTQVQHLMLFKLVLNRNYGFQVSQKFSNPLSKQHLFRFGDHLSHLTMLQIAMRSIDDLSFEVIILRVGVALWSAACLSVVDHKTPEKGKGKSRATSGNNE